MRCTRRCTCCMYVLNQILHIALYSYIAIGISTKRTVVHHTVLMQSPATTARHRPCFFLNNGDAMLSVRYTPGEQCYVKPYFKSTNTFFIMMGQSRHPSSVFKGPLSRKKISPPKNFSSPRIKILSDCVKKFCPTLKIFVRLD